MKYCIIFICLLLIIYICNLSRKELFLKIKHIEPHLSVNDKNMFYKYLDNCTNYFEYGSGGSTYQATIRSNIKSIKSIESDKKWFDFLNKKIGNLKHVNLIYCNMQSKPNSWGNPGINSNIKEWINYSSQIENFKLNKIDLILIDGRFRVACCLKCFSIIDNNCKIAFDDFLNRKYYHVVLDFFHIIEKTTDNRMVILVKKKCNPPSSELISIYEKIKN